MRRIQRRHIRIPVGDRAVVTAVVSRPEGGGRDVAILGHGAGGTIDTPALAGIAHRLAQRGLTTVRYNFPFSEAGRHRPDFPRFLQATTVAAAQWAESHLDAARIVLGGKSLGGRMSSHVVADHGYPAAGLLFLGYPLHPPRRENVLRDSHLYKIDCPMLFVEGTRDVYANLDLLRPVLERLRGAGTRADLHVIEGADHDFRVPAKLRRAYEDVLDEVADATVGFVATLP